MQRAVIILAAMTIYLSLSGFQCASTEMTSAKIALQNKDFEKAESSLQQEVAARPANGEAWYLLSEMYFNQERFLDMKRSIEQGRKATEPALTPEQLQNTGIFLYNGWKDTYNTALRRYNDGEYDRALAYVDTAAMLRPGYPENLYFKATILAKLERDQDAKSVYRDYITMIDPTVERGLAEGLSLGMTPASVEKKLGAPTARQVNDTLGGYFFYGPKNLYVYFAPIDDRLVSDGWWFYDANDVTPTPIRQAPITLRSSPHVLLGLAAYDRATASRAAADYNEALKYLQMVQRIDPGRDVGDVISNIYIATDRVDEAIAALEAEIKANPNAPQAYIQYGNLLFGLKRFKESATQFARVLEIGLPKTDENYTIALFNLGAVYKNMSAALQDSLRNAVGNRPTDAQREVYFAPLRESVKYFEQLHAIQPNDMKVLIELGNMYDLLGDRDNLAAMISRLERLEGEFANSAEYWRGLSRLYMIQGNQQKAATADKKAQALGG